MLMEPGRMWRRYIIGNPAFLARAWLEARKLDRNAKRAAPPGIHRQKRWEAQLAAKRIFWRSRDGVSAAIKRSLDIAGASAGLVLLSPILFSVAAAIRLESPGPVFFRQERIGRDGEVFRMIKFRSMYVDAEARRKTLEAQNEMSGGVLFKMRNDPRVTRVGRLIRRASIDEMPQFWNVIRGEMSLVGPRPPLPSEVAEYSVADRQRLLVKPGITCIWQVSGRSDIPFEQQVEMDLDYIHTQSLRSDLRLLFQTIPAVLLGRGAY
jgi:exopolysaccharide biosynthesis polyprenyl glycosylphosphotransferase